MTNLSQAIDKTILKIACWNVSGLRSACKKGFLDQVKRENPDILCLSQTQCQEKLIPFSTKNLGYEYRYQNSQSASFFKEQKCFNAYGGVGIFSKIQARNILDQKDFGDLDNRVITLEFPGFYLINSTHIEYSICKIIQNLIASKSLTNKSKLLFKQKPVIQATGSGLLDEQSNFIDLTKQTEPSPSINQEEKDFYTLIKALNLKNLNRIFKLDFEQETHFFSSSILKYLSVAFDKEVYASEYYPLIANFELNSDAPILENGAEVKGSFKRKISREKTIPSKRNRKENKPSHHISLQENKERENNVNNEEPKQKAILDYILPNPSKASSNQFQHPNDYTDINFDEKLCHKQHLKTQEYINSYLSNDNKENFAPSSNQVSNSNSDSNLSSSSSKPKKDLGETYNLFENTAAKYKNDSSLVQHDLKEIYARNLGMDISLTARDTKIIRFMAAGLIGTRQQTEGKISKELLKPYFIELGWYLQNEIVKMKRTVYPPRANLWNAFKLTDFDKVRVVILGQDPYHDVNQAHGLCFSVCKTVKLPPSLKNIFKELESDLSLFETTSKNLKNSEQKARLLKRIQSGNLEGWAKQGVLLLNTVLTVRAHYANSHKLFGWQHFTTSIVRTLDELHSNLVFVLQGKEAQNKFCHIINHNKHLVLMDPHPSPFSARTGFFGSRPFTKINEYLIEKARGPPIDQFAL